VSWPAAAALGTAEEAGEEVAVGGDGGCSVAVEVVVPDVQPAAARNTISNPGTSDTRAKRLVLPGRPPHRFIRLSSAASAGQSNADRRPQGQPTPAALARTVHSKGGPLAIRHGPGTARRGRALSGSWLARHAGLARASACPRADSDG
jgi:hypothetical protein